MVYVALQVLLCPPYLQKIAERGITQNDIDVLNAINQQVLVTKKQNKDDIILWLLEHSNFATEDYIDPYIFSQYLRKNNIEIQQPLWVAPNDRMGNYHNDFSVDNANKMVSEQFEFTPAII